MLCKAVKNLEVAVTGQPELVYEFDPRDHEKMRLWIVNTGDTDILAGEIAISPSFDADAPEAPLIDSETFGTILASEGWSALIEPYTNRVKVYLQAGVVQQGKVTGKDKKKADMKVPASTTVDIFVTVVGAIAVASRDVEYQPPAVPAP